MKLKIKVQGKRSYDWGTYYKYESGFGHRMLVCDTIHDYYQLRPSDRLIELTFSTEKTKNAHKVRLKYVGCYSEDAQDTLLVGGRWTEECSGLFAETLRKFPKRTAYVSVEVLS